MKKKNIVLLILILSISIGFAILSSNLGIGSNIAVADASFEVHFDNVEKIDSSIENDTYTFNQDNTTLNFTIPLDKPGDYINYKFYIVNSGTIDASLNSLTVSIPQAAQNYITYELTYFNGKNPTNGDILKRGVNKALKLHIEYKYDINNFISLENTTISVSLSYNQPQPIDKNIWNFDYEASEQTFIIPRTGTYKLEAWGAQGGGNGTNYIGGYGGYSTGTISLTKGDKLYINIGGTTTNGAGGYNGGGYVGSNYGGGGATHISTRYGLLSSLNSFRNEIIIVAGGGGGSGGEDNHYFSGGSGGGYQGNNGSGDDYGTGGTQTAGGLWSGKCNDLGILGNGSFGAGGIGVWYKEKFGGGGGGFFGGGTGSGSLNNGSGGGGSGYIGNQSLTNKVMYCYNCTESTATDTRTISTTNVSETPTSNYAKIGNGYVKITWIN